MTITVKDQERDMLSELQRRKQLFTSLYFSTLTHQEMNLFTSHMLMWTMAAERVTEMIVKGLELDESESESESESQSKPQFQSEPRSQSESSYLCLGSGLPFPRSSSAVLCYCGKRFSRRFNSRQDIWFVPKHYNHSSSPAL